ncbi:hypothetical protein CY0110_00150 [Crocosphaera chwakensis CCY0110]|uniref:HigA protein (Antitoxin to HigB) n=2 Tax=Crocosphaera TaxID=263510 RepID=A3IN45_9CHRO|nr:hypothetical protein CY0110_00150 [Crocosphaera chwakensis CCY0110]
MAKTTFSDIVEAVDQLTLEDQENLIHLLQNRIREQKRAELVRDVHEAQQEFSHGKCKPATPEQIIEDMLS